ncbi:hypothetical protein RHGRI_012133 [Rhododendron griersonianum]|uniref:Uncharacterized protein n=1 Tax=Rhododendron griersonianum TaxID=479676 RepID=A0AAV6KQM4_9ERIC|nr:hypothetical protein RHGRI_012133 [Rhododendron griersonianum]
MEDNAGLWLCHSRVSSILQEGLGSQLLQPQVFVCDKLRPSTMGDFTSSSRHLWFFEFRFVRTGYNGTALEGNTMLILEQIEVLSTNSVKSFFELLKSPKKSFCSAIGLVICASEAYGSRRELKRVFRLEIPFSAWVCEDGVKAVSKSN